MEFEIRTLPRETPSTEEFLQWQQLSGASRKQFVNTNGKKYKDLGLKDTIDDMTDEEVFALVASDGMLVKRPLLVGDDFVLFGFRKKEWEAWEW